MYLIGLGLEAEAFAFHEKIAARVGSRSHAVGMWRNDTVKAALLPYNARVIERNPEFLDGPSGSETRYDMCRRILRRSTYKKSCIYSAISTKIPKSLCRTCDVIQALIID